jgi:hypothetical protein
MSAEGTERLTQQTAARLCNSVEMAGRSLAISRGWNPDLSGHALMTEAARCLGAFFRAEGQAGMAGLLDEMANQWEAADAG